MTFSERSITNTLYAIRNYYFLYKYTISLVSR